MWKKLFSIIFIIIALPVCAEYMPLSDEPITDPDEFMREYEQSLPVTGQNAGQEYSEQEEPSTPPPANIKPSKNYTEIYNSLELPKFSYMHDIDPDQYYDMKDATWAPYPLLRLNSAIYFKERTIEPGYYLLTPREYKGNWYLLFKQNGVVMHIIPIYERDLTPEFFYDEHLPKPKLTFAQKVHMGTLNLIGKTKSSKRKEPIKSYMEINDLENHFVSIVIYYGNHKYHTIFRTIKL